MSIITLKEALRYASNNDIAIGSFNAVNLDMARGIINAAEDTGIPVILSLAESHFTFAPLDLFGPIIVGLANRSKGKIVVHLDHGMDFNFIKKAVEIGFSSIMYDGSHHSLQNNISITKKVVELCHANGVSVEAEVGRLVTPETGSNEKATNLNPEDYFTDVTDAQLFVDETNVDALAIAFGTAHGLYKDEPKLNYELIKSITGVIKKPLVMHGGSGLREDQYKSCINNGIRKINYYSDMAFRVTNQLREDLNSNSELYLHDISKKIIEYVKRDVSNKILLFASNLK